MATVYLAQDLRHDRPVALKVLTPSSPPRSAPSGSSARSTGRRALQHPHILPVLDSGEAVDASGSLCHTSRASRSGIGSDARSSSPSTTPYGFTREVALALDYAHRARRRSPRHQARKHPALATGRHSWPISASPTR